jgi:hypothetical protein
MLISSIISLIIESIAYKVNGADTLLFEREGR